MSLLKKIKRTDISAAEEFNLVATVRSTDTGTSAHDEALTALISAYIGDIIRASRTARVIDTEDAEQVAMEKFINIVRDEVRTNERLAGFVGRSMNHAVMAADAEASPVRIPRDTLRRYFNLVRETGSLAAAYQAAVEGKGGFDAVTLLAVARGLNAESVEALMTTEDGETNEVDKHLFEAATPSHEEAVVQDDLIRWLFGLLSPEEDLIIRLHYGFTEAHVEALRIRFGYQWDAPLSDAQIGPAVNMGRATVNRRRLNALRTMREGMNSLLAESDA